jgi:hypothetical protein
VIFWKFEVAQRKGNILGNFLFEQLFYSFTKVSNFKICFCTFKKWFDVFWLFSKNWAFFTNVLVGGMKTRRLPTGQPTFRQP